MCQRPRRASFISTITCTYYIYVPEKCQRPKRAFLISTRQITNEIVNKLLCVNALNGLFLFLRESICYSFQNQVQCQRPKRAFLISTKLRQSSSGNMCVNTLNGLFLFLL